MDNYVDNIICHSEEIPIESFSLKNRSTSENAFFISDEKGKAIVEFKDGHIKTKEFDSRIVGQVTTNDSDDIFGIEDENGNKLFCVDSNGIKIDNTVKVTTLIPVIENSGIANDGSLMYNASSYNQFKRSAFFINKGESVAVSFSKSLCVVKYDNVHALVSFSVVNANSLVSLSDCTYIMLHYANTEGNDGDIVCKFYGGEAREEKRVALRTPSERLLYHVDGEMYTAALMMLPPNYSPTGKKVPLILWDSGDGSYKNWDTYEMGTGYERRRIGLEYLRDQGFAVLEIYSWGSYYYNKYYGCGGRSAMGIPTHLKTHEKGVEYVCSRYNIDPENVFEISKSGSGKISLHYAIDKPNFNLKAIYAFAPVFDDLNFMSWGMADYRKALYEELNLEGTEDQIDQFLNGTPKDKGGNGTSWVYFNPVPRAEGDLDPTDADDLAIYNANLQSNQAFIANNFHKFTKIVPGWINLVGQTAAEKLADTKNFAIDFWNNMSAVNTEPSNWSTNYTNYYEYFSDAGGYRKLVEQAQAPEFVAGRYFSFNPGDPTLENRIYTRHNLQMVGNQIPFTVIMAVNDEQTPYWNCLEVVNQLRNGGDEASIYTLPSQGHSAPDMGTVEQATDVTTMCGQHYDAVSVGWYMACADIQRRYLAHIDKDVYDYVYPSE